MMPQAALAASATNTATVTVPSGAFEINSSNNSATDTDNVLASMVATNDSATGINGLTGATAVVNAFTGDTVNGAAASTSNAVLSVASGSSVPAGLTFDTATGNVNVAAGTPAGTYSFDRECQRGNSAAVYLDRATAVGSIIAGCRGRCGRASGCSSIDSGHAVKGIARNRELRVAREPRQGRHSTKVGASQLPVARIGQSGVGAAKPLDMEDRIVHRLAEREGDGLSCDGLDNEIDIARSGDRG